MTTPIGQSLTVKPRKRVAAAVVGLLTVAVDLIVVSQHMWYERGVLPLIAVIVLLELADGDRLTLGFRTKPLQGWSYWARMTLWLGLVVVAVLTACAWVLMVTGYELPVITTAPNMAGTRFWQMCINAPILEEGIYRFALCVPLAALMRPWVVIMTSGVAFGLLHVVYGNPSPENAVGGFILAWAFLKSGSIYVPVMLHGLGNFCVLAAQVTGWYWLRGA